MTKNSMLCFQEKKGPIGAEKSYAYSESAKDFVPVIKEEDSGSITSAKEKVKRWLCEAFLPIGYPDSVSSDYLHYQFWDSAQAYCSSIAGALSLQATLTGLGVGEASATSLAATLTWLLKDGAGMVASIFFAYWRGSQLDCNSKQWRLFADVANDFSHFLKLVAPLLPFPFMAIMCFSAVMTSLVGVSGGATRAAFSYHQARHDNMADVSAKDGSQETMVNLAALITNLTVLPFITSSLTCTWITFIFCVFLHLLTNYLAVRALKMESLNRPRILLILKSWFEKASVPGVEEVNLTEPLLLGPAFITEYFPFGYRLSLGSSLHCALQKTERKDDLKNVYMQLMETFARENFIIVGDISKKYLSIIYQDEISSDEELEAFYVAYLSVLNYIHMRENIMLSAEHIAPGLSLNSSTCDIIQAVRLHARKNYPEFVQSLSAKGWFTNKLLLAAEEWRLKQ